MRLAGAIPMDPERGFAVMWAVADLVQPALDLARTPGTHSPRDLATAIFNGGGSRLAAVHDAIDGVEALHADLAFSANRARAVLDAWFAALPFVDDATPFAPGAGHVWARDQVNVRLREVIGFAGLVIPRPE